MKKALTVFAFAFFVATQVFATYVVVLKDGTKYKAKAKWTVVNGKALVHLENGQVLSLNPGDIDLAKSEQITKLGLGDVTVISTGDPMPASTQPKQGVPTLGATVRLRKQTSGADATPTPAATGTAPKPAALADELDGHLKDMFERAYENVGIFEHKLAGTNAHVRAELTADSEDKVFNALSATAFLMVRNAGSDNVNIELVEIFMKTTNGGAAGRFQMNRIDAAALNDKSMTREDYFVRKVIY